MGLFFTCFYTVPGATKSVYAPEPCDVGRVLQADISIDDHTITVSTSAPIDPGPLKTHSFSFLFLISYSKTTLLSHTAAGLGNYVEALVRRHDTEFAVCYFICRT